MEPKIRTVWLPMQRIDGVIQAESVVLILSLALSSWIFYALFLKALTPERHRNLRALFQNLLFHSVHGIAAYAAYWGLQNLFEPTVTIQRLLPFVGLATIFSGCIVIVKTCRIFAFEYLFVTNMRVGVPLLIVNLLSLGLSLLIIAWVLTGVFGLNLAPLLATSAIFSIVLGLALQDTLGNLVAGVALQLDKTYEIGDWIEVHNSGTKFVGVVDEITWRATILIGFGDEIITIPNRVIAQANILNFAAKTRPFIRSQVFRLPFGTDIQSAKEVLFSAVSDQALVQKLPEPLVLLTETSESWLNFKVVYHIKDYGKHVVIADRINQTVADLLDEKKISFARNELVIHQK